MKVIDCQSTLFGDYRQALLAGAKRLSPFYQPLNTAYYQDYFACTHADCSFIIELGKQALVLVLISEPHNGRADYFGQPVQLVWHSDITEQQQKGALKVVLKHIGKICPLAECSIRFEETMDGELSGFARHLLGLQGTPGVKYHQWIDLSRSEEQLFSDMRKIYRANVRWGQEHMTYRLLTPETIQPNDIEAFRQLHIEVAGKETRSAHSWQLQQHMIEAGEAYAIYGYLEERLVATGLFVHNKDVCYYGVGAYARDLFDKSISHALVWQGICHAKAMGCAIMDMGEAHFKQVDKPDGQLPNPKDLTISHFKQGFGGELVGFLCF